ncbi:MAG: rRNA methyltransferase [Chryseolinea sp.]
MLFSPMIPNGFETLIRKDGKSRDFILLQTTNFTLSFPGRHAQMVNFPQDFKNRMLSQLGTSWILFESSHKLPAPVSIRINPCKSDFANPMPVPWTKYGFYLEQRPAFTLDPEFHAGKYYVQEASSMFLEQAFKQVATGLNSIRVLDLCAAPGGKSTHLLSLMDENSLLVTNEVIRARANILSENIQKWGYDNVIVTNNDPHDFSRLESFFDIVVVDAPCSGEGLFRKDPEATSSWSLENVAHCSKRQKRILEDVWPAVKEGGYLIYSTCTYSQAEDEENMTWLANKNDVEFITLELPAEWNIETIVQGNVIGYHLYPHKVNGEGFFLSAVRKMSGTPTRVGGKSGTLTQPPKAHAAQLQSWLLQPESKALFQHNDEIHFFPRQLLSDLELLSKRIYIHHAGVGMATAKHDKLIPSHGAALSLSLRKENFQIIDLTLAQALQFLRKETLNLGLSGKGYALVEYNGMPLGWINILSNRVNNLYPSEWRIRM